MALYGAFDKTRHFAELADNATDQHGNLLTPTVRRNTAFQNLTGNGSITAAEVARLTGSSIANATVSAVAVLDAGGDLITASNVSGASITGVAVKEYGDGFNHVTVLTCSSIALSAPTDNVDSGEGFLVYTFPAGAIILDSAYMNMSVLLGAPAETDEADIGLGTVIATAGNTALLSHTATFEDIITGQTLADVDDTDPIPIAAIPTVGAPLFIASGDAHTVHFNVASDWADAGTVTGLTASGTIILNWKFLE